MLAFRYVILLQFLCMPPGPLHAEDGDQFLDSIGETALISRYVFDGDLDDWSRNGLDATAHGDGHEFTKDATFGKVLSLSGGSEGAYISIPTGAIGDAISFSAVGWVRITDKAENQWFFDLGSDSGHHLGIVPMGVGREDGCSVRLANGETVVGPTTARVSTGQWVHLATVLDAAGKTLSLYVDGKRVGRTRNIKTSLASLGGAGSRLYLGRSIAAGGTRLGAQVHDLRFYRIALSDRQVAAIHHNAVSEEKITSVETEVEGFQEDRARLLHGDLESVAEVRASTEVGHLPVLPRYVAGIYRDGAEGPPVRVIWPAPTDNRSVAKPGRYTIIGKVPGTEIDAKATVEVLAASGSADTPERNLSAFPLDQVILTGDKEGRPTIFMQHRDKFLAGLAKSDPDRFLWVFRDAFGRPQPDGARPLGAWETPETRVRGQASGHYLTALAQAYASASDKPDLQAELGRKMAYMIGTLHELSQMSGKAPKGGQTAVSDPTRIPIGPGKSDYDSNLTSEGIRRDYWNWGEGFISGYPPDQFIMLEKGATYGGGYDQVWAPYYVLHKILTGLVDCYEVGGDPRALEVATRMALWVHERLKVLPRETLIRMWDSYIAGEFGGMNEILARLHRLSGDIRFLETAKLFDNTTFFFGDAEETHGLAKNVDTIRGRHSNQHIPQILGALETYRSSREPRYFKIAENFWNHCQHGYMYSIGGVAGARNPNNAECFTAEPDSLFRNGFSEGGQNETCATYNLLKLARELFMFEQDSRYMDYYERAIYNHILASVDKTSCANTYHVPLNPGSKKSFGNPHMDSFTCCNGTAIESGSKLQDSIYFRSADNSSLYVNLFVPSTLDWKDKGVKLTQSTSFPFSGTTTLTLEGGGDFLIHIRVPAWIGEGFAILINGEARKVAATPGSYAVLDRKWQDGDVIQITLPMSFHLMPLMDQPNIASLFHGPVLLAAEEPEARSTWRSVVLDTDKLEASITGDPATLRFRIGETKLKPFFDFHAEFHSVYLDIQPRE